MKTVKELHLLVGLPGSGKTTFANTYSKSNNSNNKIGDIIDFDAIFKKAGLTETLCLNYEAVEKMRMPLIKNPYVIIDGLFLEQEEYEWVLNLFINGEQFKDKVIFENIVIDYWRPRVENCVWNDRGRRETNAEFTIRIVELEKPNVKEIEKKFGIPTKLKLHDVERKPAYLIMAGENGYQDLKDGKYLCSDEWITGGSYSSWDSDKVSAIAGETPCEFDAFDELLEKVCPNITFLQYKKIFKECVALDEFCDNDYYSRVEKCRYVCDMEKLYNMLEEMKLYKVK